MNKKIISLISLFSLVAISSTVFGTTYAYWIVTDNASTRTANITVGGTLRTLNFYTEYADSSWGTPTTKTVMDGGKIDISQIPSVTTPSGYTFTGWTTSAPSTTNYTAIYSTNALLSNAIISADISLYPILESNVEYAYANSTYFALQVDVTINSSSLTDTKLGKRYVGITGIPNPTGKYDGRTLTSSSGIYQFVKGDAPGDDGFYAANLNRKIGFSTEHDTTDGSVWKAASYNSNGRGLWAQAGADSSDGGNYTLTRDGNTEKFYAYIPYQQTRFYFKNYSYQQDGKDLESGEINVSDGYNATSWVLRKTGNYWNGWTVSNGQASWGAYFG